MSTTFATRTELLPVFLEDWKPDHRPLCAEHRATAGRYIAAIALRPVLKGASAPLSGEFSKRVLWQRFRELYDEMAGSYARSDREDFAKAMERL